jgi:hypothetical protein
LGRRRTVGLRWEKRLDSFGSAGIQS